MMFIKMNTAYDHVINSQHITDVMFFKREQGWDEEYALINLTDGRGVRTSHEEANRVVAILTDADKPESSFVTSYIVRVERSTTIIANRPVWRCITNDGFRLYIYKHEQPHIDNFAMFEKAGWADDLNAIELYQTVDLEMSIPVTLKGAGEWYEIVLVHNRSDDSLIDVESF